MCNQVQFEKFLLYYGDRTVFILDSVTDGPIKHFIYCQLSGRGLFTNCIVVHNEFVLFIAWIRFLPRILTHDICLTFSVKCLPYNVVKLTVNRYFLVNNRASWRHEHLQQSY